METDKKHTSEEVKGEAKLQTGVLTEIEDDNGRLVVMPSLEELEASLLNESDPIAKRIRSVFYLKHLGGEKAIDILAKGLASPSVLLSHEIAFVLGQMKNPYAVPMLTETLKNETYDPILRHEAAESLGAIGLDESLAVLEQYCSDPRPEVSDTCKLAADRIRWAKKNKESDEFGSKYYTVDPAPAFKQKRTTEELEAVLTNSSLSMFERYRAMFALRNQGDEPAIKALAAGFNDSSAVFRHEIAYVMGQIQHPCSVPYLTEVLQRENEHAMVRHEAAEALGSIADEATTELLQSFQKDSDLIVKQSCDVALDIMEYWSEPVPQPSE